MTDVSGTGDPQDVAESLDGDEIDSDDDYTGTGAGNYPPERPMGSLDQAITPAEEAFPEGVAERERRLTPDPLAEELQEAAVIEDELGAMDADELADLEDELRGPTEDLFADLDDDEVLALDEELALELAAGDQADDDLVAEDAIGSLVDPDASVGDAPSFDDAEADEVASAGGVLGDEGPEDAAMHLTSEPAWHRSDGYVEDE